jgi:hypothetical protein
MLQSYALECKTSSVATHWSALSTNTGNGALRQLSDPAATAPQRFYRMRQWQPPPVKNVLGLRPAQVYEGER